MAQANPAAAVANIYRTPELWEKIVFTFLCLVIYRVGSYIAVPGVNVPAMVDFFRSQQGGGLLGLYDLFVGGNLSRSTVFALGIMPYISASIILQMGTHIIPRTRIKTAEQAPEGRQAYLERVHGEHESIYNAIRNHDADAARAAMRTHLANSRERRRRLAR